MVEATEALLWSQNVEYIKAMQEALAKNKADDSLITNIIQKAVDEDQRIKDGMKKAMLDGMDETLQEGGDATVDIFKKTYGSLAEEASSPLVQAELAAMQQAAAETMENVAQGVSSLSASLQSISAEFAGVKIDGDTPVNVLNDLISRYPVNTEPKG
jgi:hypothetical protein